MEHTTTSISATSVSPGTTATTTPNATATANAAPAKTFTKAVTGKSISIISGGTATNELVKLFESLSPNISYILPISDNGGSTSELLRVIGGPAIGDIRSRLTRLIPDKNEPIRVLLSHRLPKVLQDAKLEWSLIVDGTHSLWDKIDPAVKEIIRSFLIHVHTELLKRSRNSAKNFRLELASVGNLFLTGVRLFCGSLDSAVELVLRICKIPSSITIVPCLNTNFTYHISALLKNGEIITGQSQISHPGSLNPQIITRSQLSNHHTDFKLRSNLTMHPPPISSSVSTSPNTHMGEHALNNLSHSNISTSSLTEDNINSKLNSLEKNKIKSENLIYGTTHIFNEDDDNLISQNGIDETSFVTDSNNENIDESLFEIENMHIHDVNKDISFHSVPKTVEENEYEDFTEDEDEYATPSYTHPDLKVSQLHISKDECTPLAAPIERIFYISPYGEEIYPQAQTRVLKRLSTTDCVVYSIGSLMTSIIPVIILQGVGEAIMNEKNLPLNQRKKKILLLNGTLDRETSSLTALGFLKSIMNASIYSMYTKRRKLSEKTALSDALRSEDMSLSSFVTHLVHLNPSRNISIEEEKIESLGIKCVPVNPDSGDETHYDLFDLREKINSIINGEL
ncbi:hypothetical protein B5S28_g28 [[Candida] boidinii]|nr:hypothetical protein B5S28_g28 [[Candida] boidinii]OWB59227.1 hypothetical protein B5S29_g81 [[Candida] boidinii]OWB70908.1 hypothetical protein B5S31_g589 [[Candida] boidinii]